MNSSQAFAFNLYFPYFSGGSRSAAILLRALGQEGDLIGWQLEDVPVEHEGTNIDAWWKTSIGIQTFCEVKLSERSFGKAPPDEEHLKKLRTIYSERLRGHLDPAQLEPAAFFRDYQFYRNIWHMVGSANSYLIFLLPRANAGLWKRLHQLLPSILPETRARISAVAIEDVLTKLAACDEGPLSLQGYGSKLVQKYIVRK